MNRDGAHGSHGDLSPQKSPQGACFRRLAAFHPSRTPRRGSNVAKQYARCQGGGRNL
ncbi:hypothetical protein STVIR_7815 [Streptomyces viridochromogenes Tue57]|uniref:Uncharacterized protein n=1 Tax=Streptomyces viridochromogenes Tue57 TaxID=1160705 RepID=L8P4V8_STRVR|nr:hypothetical protein STVIR_7815 [Streptomyces viridochromogenes Tue57]